MILEIIVIVVGLLIAIVLALSIRRHLLLNAFLNSPIEVTANISEQIKGLLSTDNIIIANLTLFDVLYTSLKVKVNSLDNIGDIDFRNKIDSIDDFAVLLTESVISPPFTPFHDMGAFDSNANMSIYNPLESSAIFNDDPLGTVGNLTSTSNITDVYQASGDSVADSNGLADISNHLLFHIPIIAITVKTAKNWSEYDKKNINAEIAITNTTIDAATLTAGSLGGAALGTKFGMILGPVTGGVSIFLGPIVGTAIGLIGGGAFSNWLKMQLYGGKYKRVKKEFEKEVNILERNARSFRREFLARYKQLKSTLKNQHEDNLSNIRLRWKSNENILKRFFFPNLKSRVFHKSLGKMKKEYKTSTKPYYEKLYKQIQMMSDYKGGLLLFGQGKERFINVSPLTSIYNNISNSIDIVKKKKRELEDEIQELNKKL